MPSYKFLEHMTDAEIEAYGKDLEEAFENAGRAVEDTMVDIHTVSNSKPEVLVVEGEDKESLLYLWLEALINKQDIEGMLYSKFHCTISKRKNGNLELSAAVSGEKFDPAKHEQKTAIKAPTYHGMKIVESPKDKRVTMKFLLDL